MARHITDHQTSKAEGSRLARFMAIVQRSGNEGEHPAARAALRKSGDVPDANRTLQEFVRIERGAEA